MESLLAQGIELAILGMGTVFVFLALLILATRTMSSIVLRFEPELSASGSTETQDSALSQDGKLLAIISAAVMQHRNKNNK